MTTIINASTSAGLVQTADTSGVLALQTGGTTAITVGTDQSTTFEKAANLPNTFGFKNRIINGAMVIDQRNAGASITPTATVYSVDRWQATVNVASKASFDQTTTAPTGFTNSMLVTSLSAYSVAAGDLVTYRQQIEGFNIADLGWGTASAATITVSFWVRSSLTGTFGGSIKNGGSTRSYPFTYTISAANTFEQKSVTIAGDTSGTWPTDNTSGLILSFGLGVGSTTSGTAGAWATANYNSATGATSVVGTNGATFYITGVQLEKGSTATSFDYRPYGTELQLCQRYYEIGTAYGDGYTTINASVWLGYIFKVTKRVAPDMTFPTFTNGTNARAGATRSIFVDSYARYMLANATGALYAYETFTAAAEL